MDMAKMMIDAYMKPLYDLNPSGQLLADIQNFENELYAFTADNPGAVDIVGESGKRDIYNGLYIAAMNGGMNEQLQINNADNAVQTQPTKNRKLPTVSEFLSSYRYIYETSVKPYNKPLTDAAYQRLFDIENRTDDLLEAQIIIEKEGLIIDTVTADYKNIVKDFMDAVDPNYEITSAAAKATLGVYGQAKSLEEITYMGEVAATICDDIAVQIKLKVEMMTTLASLIFAWENSKRKIREGDPKMDKYAQAMVITRKQVRRYYKFLQEDMGLSFDVLEKTPFYMISLLKPEGLDALWRIKKVMHPDNIKAMRYAIFEEILSSKSMEEILMTPQPYPYYESMDVLKYPQVQDEFMSIAAELNKNIKYFRENDEIIGPSEDVMKKANDLIRNAMDTSEKKEKKAVTVRNDIEQKTAHVQSKIGGKGLFKSLFKR